jgi:hypothetical protein
VSYVVPILRTREQLIADVEHRLQDRGNRRWTDGQIVRAINDGLALWHGRVAIPYIYTLAGGWASGTYEYALPSYIPAVRLQPQRRVATAYVSESGSSQQYIWQDVLGWDVEPDGAGGQVLRVRFNEGTVGTSGEARLLYWAENGPLPEVRYVPSGTVDASSTEPILLPAFLDVGQSGYVKWDDEWVQYSGTSDLPADGGTELQNVVRGVNGTAAEDHTGSTGKMDWAVGVPSRTLWQQLYSQTMANLHGVLLSDAPGQEREQHQWQMQWNQQRADEFWRGWTPATGPRLKLSRRSGGMG